MQRLLPDIGLFNNFGVEWMKSARCVTTLAWALVFALVTAHASFGQGAEQGTGQGGCYFGQGPGCANPAPSPPVLPQPPQGGQSYHYVDDTRPPDAFLALRTNPSGSSGSRLMEMPNGTLLQVLEQRPDGWWRVRVMPSGPEGWALNRMRDRVWIHCCRKR